MGESDIRSRVMSLLVKNQHTFTCDLCGAPRLDTSYIQDRPCKAWIAAEHVEHPQIKAVILDVCESCRHALLKCRICSCFLVTDDSADWQGICRANAPRGVVAGGHRAAMPIMTGEGGCINDFVYRRPLTIAEVQKALNERDTMEPLAGEASRGAADRSRRHDIPWPTAELYVTYPNNDVRDRLIDEVNLRNGKMPKPYILLVTDVLFNIAGEAGTMLYDVPAAQADDLRRELEDSVPGTSCQLTRPTGFQS